MTRDATDDRLGRVRWAMAARRDESAVPEDEDDGPEIDDEDDEDPEEDVAD